MRAIQLKASELGARVFRNNQGLCRCRKTPIKYGVCNPGGSDLIGWNPYGRFLAIEVKVHSRTTIEQTVFLKAVIESGGIGIIAHSTDDITFDTLTNK